MTGDGDYLAEVEKMYMINFTIILTYTDRNLFPWNPAKDVNKGKALEALLAILGVDRDELMAFGDGYNDKQW